MRSMLFMPAADSAVGVWLRGEPGRGSRHTGLDGRRPFLPEPRACSPRSRAPDVSMWWPSPANDREVQQLLDSSKCRPGGARAARLRTRPPSRPHHLGAGLDQRNQLQHRVHRLQLCVFHHHQLCRRSDGGSRNRDTAGRAARFPRRSPSTFRNMVMQSRVWFNPDLHSRNYFVPGIVVNIIMLMTLMLTAMAIVREKEIGTMEQLMVTPIRPIELMLGKTLPFALVGLVDTVLVVVAACCCSTFLFAAARCCCSSARSVPDDLARRGSLHLHHFADAAAGHDDHVPVFPAVLPAERLCFPHPQHAGCRSNI